MATRVCPQCGSQYVASVRSCIDCDVALVDEVEPEAAEPATTASPLGDGDQIAYELEGWGNQLKVTLEGMLDQAGIRRVWESGALVVPAANEEEVDALVATVEGSDVVELDDDAPQVAFEIEGLGPDELADLDTRLIAAHLAHAWDEDGALLVAEADEEQAAAIVDEAVDGPADDELDGLVVQEALSGVYVAVDKLMKDSDDAKLRVRYVGAAAALDGLPVPYGLSGADWQSLGHDVSALAALVRPGSEEDEDEGDEADVLDGDDGHAFDGDGTGDGHEDEDGDGDGDGADDGDGGTATDDRKASVATMARALRERLHELV